MAKRRPWIAGIFVSVAAAGALLAVVNNATQRQSEAAVARLRAKTAPLRAQKQPPTTPAQNAGHPTDEGEIPENPAERPSTAEAYAKLLELTKAVGKSAEWKDVFTAAHKPKAKLTEQERTQIESFLKAHREIILELRRLADSGEKVVTLDWSRGSKTDLKQVSALLRYSCLLAVDAAALARVDKHEEAVADIFAGLKLARTLRDEPSVSVLDYRLSIEANLYDAVQDSIRGEHLSPGLLQRLAQHVSTSDSRASYAYALQSDVEHALSFFDAVRTGKPSSYYSEEFSELSFDNQLIFSVYGSAIAQPWFNRDEAAYADFALRLSETATLPYYQAQPIRQEILSEIENLPRTRLLAALFLPKGPSVYQEFQAVNEVHSDLMILGLTIEYYHGQTGRYPENLEQVTSLLGSAIPVSPLTGQSYVYHPGADSFELHTPLPEGGGFGLENRNPYVDANGNISWRNRKQRLAAAPETPEK